MSVFEYSSGYHPAAPVCEIYLGRAGQPATIGPLPALLDTGSDMTIIPTTYLRQIQAKRISRGQARSIWGDTRTVGIYMVSFALHDLQISTLQVLEDHRTDEIVIGRFVLNRFKIMLDGPSAMTEFMEMI
ncbi:hypothetical protein QUF58_00700 [Anaerolineales bacterium HSG24]|nr:hypothetical protein [Anaerolineales bacterium HSG24]